MPAQNEKVPFSKIFSSPTCHLNKSSFPRSSIGVGSFGGAETWAEQIATGPGATRLQGSGQNRMTWSVSMPTNLPQQRGPGERRRNWSFTRGEQIIDYRFTWFEKIKAGTAAMVRRIFQHFAREIQAPGEFGLQMYQWISKWCVVCCVWFVSRCSKDSSSQNIGQNPSSWMHHAKQRFPSPLCCGFWGFLKSSFSAPRPQVSHCQHSLHASEIKVSGLLAFICSKGTLILLLAFLLLHKSSKGIFRGVGA